MRASGRGGTFRPASLAVGAAIGIALTLTVAAIGGLTFSSHIVCVQGGDVADVLFWTPWSLVNAPYLGSTNYTAHFWLYELFGPTNVTLKGGFPFDNISAGGYFETENWTVFSQANSSQLGPGSNSPCRSAYGAERSLTRFTVSTNGANLESVGNTSDMNEPTTFPNATSQHPSAVFANGFVEANQAPVSTCGGPAKELNLTSSSFDISLTVPGPSGPITSLTSVASFENFTYHFPANGGTWQVDDLQENSGLRGPGLAFSWHAC
jgi:hypothetical protein